MALLPSCRSKQKLIRQDVEYIAAHQRHAVQDFACIDSITVFNLQYTDTFFTSIPVKSVKRQRLVTTTMNTADTVTVKANTRQLDEHLLLPHNEQRFVPSWFKESVYMLILGVICILIILYMKPKI